MFSRKEKPTQNFPIILGRLSKMEKSLSHFKIYIHFFKNENKNLVKGVYLFWFKVQQIPGEKFDLAPIF